MRRRCCCCKRLLTSSGTLGLAARRQRNTALEATLLTFCPPGPPERTKVQENSSSGIRRRSWISSMTDSCSGCLQQILPAGGFHNVFDQQLQVLNVGDSLHGRLDRRSRITQLFSSQPQEQLSRLFG